MTEKQEKEIAIKAAKTIQAIAEMSKLPVTLPLLVALEEAYMAGVQLAGDFLTEENCKTCNEKECLGDYTHFENPMEEL